MTEEPYAVSFILHGLLADYNENCYHDHLFSRFLDSTFETNVYQAPTDKQVLGLLNICNQSNQVAYISVSHSMGTSAALPEDWMLYSEEIPPYETMRLEGFPLGAGETIKAKASVADAISLVYSGMVIKLFDD